MAMSNHERVGRATDLLKKGLSPFVEREFRHLYADQSASEVARFLGRDPMLAKKPIAKWDAAGLLKLMWESWRDVFSRTLGQAERTLVSELRDIRNRWAHQEPFSSDDAYRALDSTERLLTAISAPEAREAQKMKTELLRLRFDEQMRHEKRKAASTAIESEAAGNLKPWREVVSPHQDVASGRYQQAEFAADLWQVHIGEGSDEYRDPAEFFRRTYLTESLRSLLVGAVRRLAGQGGDPVVQLQTNFGGGKTHSMLALYHLFSGTPQGELVGMDEVLKTAEVGKLPAVNRAVLVGNKISPGNPSKKPDGTQVRTLWGELAWQLGFAAGGAKEAKKAYRRVKADDEKATNPGDTLRALMNDYGPCLVLIDEWVAYARQLHDTGDLPAGSFETHFTFAQALTEAAKAAKQCLLVLSLPASDAVGSPHAVADDVEVGGERGRAALSRLRNAVGRVEASWRPASAEEGFEIVRRRLFQPLVEKAQFVERDRVAREFSELYRTQHQEFPPECKTADYEKRLKAAYPIHPEVFDRLYTEWSTLVKFQRTRGVLRLMAAVIHSLWEKGDRNPLILPALIPIDDGRVQSELTRYLSDNWVPVIEKDVDGPNALPLRTDGDQPNLGKYAACRRVARTVYLGSAPIQTAANRGIEDRRIKLGCVMPGESPAIFGDALRRLSGAATYLYQDGPRYWYSTQATVTKMAEDLAEELRRDPDKVFQEIDARLRKDLRGTGSFAKIHPLPASGADVPDELDARLVVLGIDHPHTRDKSSSALAKAQAILESRGTAPRLYRNSLVFLAVDEARLQDLDEAIRWYLAWDLILSEKEDRNLPPQQVKQAEAQRKSADGTVTARIPESFQWLLVPGQASPRSDVEWQAYRLSGAGSLAERASKKLRNDELLVTALAGTRLRLELDRVPLWRGDHVGVKQLVEDFARYLYLPRLTDSDLLCHAIEDGLGLLTWEEESFAYADAYDPEAKRYRGLRTGEKTTVRPHGDAVVVKPEAARKQLEAESKTGALAGADPSAPQPRIQDGNAGGTGGDEPPGLFTPPAPPPAPLLRRFHGTADLDAVRLSRDAGRIAEEVVTHLSSLVGSRVRITLEIHADLPEGAPENVLRTVTENCRTLKFKTFGFEEE